MKKLFLILLLIPFATKSQTLVADTVFAIQTTGGTGTQTLIIDTIKYVTYRNVSTTPFIRKTDTTNVVATTYRLSFKTDSVAAALAAYTQSRINDTAAAIRTTVNGKAPLLINNFSTSNQTVNAATTALLVGSLISVPVGKLQIGTQFRFTISLSKTNAGTAANTFLFKLGTAGTSSDATVLTFTTGVGTTVVDNGTIDIIITIRGPLSASCIAQGNFRLSHNLAATGLVVVPVSLNVTSGVFDATTANLKASMTVTTAASTVLTFQQVTVNVINL